MRNKKQTENKKYLDIAVVIFLKDCNVQQLIRLEKDRSLERPVKRAYWVNAT